jgi:hypothetical protein
MKAKLLIVGIVVILAIIGEWVLFIYVLRDVLRNFISAAYRWFGVW